LLNPLSAGISAHPLWPRRAVLIGAAAFAVVFFTLDLNALHALRVNQNTGLYLQSLIDFARTGSTFDQPDGKAHLLVHDQWLVLALAPLAALWPRPETLIVAQTAALGAAAIPLYFLGRTWGADARAAALLALAFLLSPSLEGYAYDGFVPEDVIPLLWCCLALALAKKSLWAGALVAQLLLGVKEDEAWFLGWFGIVAFAARERKLGGTLVALALLNGVGYYLIVRHFGYTPERPQYGLVDRAWPQQLGFLIEISVPLAFAPVLLGPRLLVGLPLLAELFFAQDRSYPLYQTGRYYTAPLVTLATIGSAYVIAGRPYLARWALAGAVVMALLFNPTVLRLGRWTRSRAAGRKCSNPSTFPAKISAPGRSPHPICRLVWSTAASPLRARSGPRGKTSRSLRMRPGRRGHRRRVKPWPRPAARRRTSPLRSASS
jgi:uncharacterized membrane protein